MLFVPCMILVTLAFVPFSVELLIYMALLAAEMCSGYLDDAADKPWNEYKKGIIDFVVALVAAVTFLNFILPTSPSWAGRSTCRMRCISFWPSC